MAANRQVPSRPICTMESLNHDFRALGIREGDTLLVHSSLGSLGWVCGGAEAVVRALLTPLGQEGTLAVPTQTEDNSDPKEWKQPPVPEEWVRGVLHAARLFNLRLFLLFPLAALIRQAVAHHPRLHPRLQPPDYALPQHGRNRR